MGVHEDRIIEINEVKDMIKLGRSTIYRMIAKGQFPKPVKIGSKTAVWFLSDVIAWLERIRIDRSA